MTIMNIPLFKVFMGDNVFPAVEKVLSSGYIGEGPKVVELEQMLAKYIGHSRILTVNSGTSALHLAYHMAINHDSDAEVISTPITCTATNTPILSNHAKIVWADVDPLTGSIDPADIEEKITSKTKALTMVHWGGNPCEIEKINAIAKKHDVQVIEDAAHGWGARYQGQPLGNYSDFVMYSLQAIKHINSVDGGVLVCKRTEDYTRGKLLRWYGIGRDNKDGADLRCEMDVVEAGYKFHMNDVCATVGLENFKHLEWIITKHRDNARFYNQAFSDCSDIQICPENPQGESSYWLYTIHVPNRDQVMQKLKEKGIMSSKVHSRSDTHSMFRSSFVPLAGVESFNRTHLCIPVGWWLTEDERNYIADHLRAIVRSVR